MLVVGKESTMAEKNATPLQPPQTQEDEEEKREMYMLYGLYQRKT